MQMFDNEARSGGDGLAPHLSWIWGEDPEASEGTLLLILRFPESGRQAVYHLHLVLDVSASMREPDRFDAALRAVRLAIGVLRDEDRFSLTLFSHEALSVVRGATVAWCRTHLEEIEGRVRGSKLLFTPKTYLEGGLRRLLERHPATASWLTRIVILTDGETMDDAFCAVLSARLPRGLEIRGLGFGEDFHPERLRAAFQHAGLGPVQMAASLTGLEEQVEHLALAGERIVGSDARIDFWGGTVLKNVVCARPSVRSLERNGDGVFADQRPLLESRRSYIYLLAIEPEVSGRARGRLELRYRSAANGGERSFTSDFPLGRPWEGCAVDPSEVRIWQAMTEPFGLERRQNLISQLEALLDLVGRQDSPDLERQRRLRAMLNSLRSGGLAMDEEFMKRVESEVIDGRTRSLGYDEGYL